MGRTASTEYGPSGWRPAGLAGALTVILAACNQTAPPRQAAQAPANPSYVTPAGFRLPEGAGCSGEIARFRAIMTNDLETGHVNAGVHGRVTADIDQAAALCGGGQDGPARVSLAATKRRYGYPG